MSIILMNEIEEYTMDTISYNIKSDNNTMNSVKIDNNETEFLNIASDLFKQYYKKYFDSDKNLLSGYNFVIQRVSAIMEEHNINISQSYRLVSKIIDSMIRYIDLDDYALLRYIHNFSAVFNFNRPNATQNDTKYLNLIVNKLMYSAYSNRGNRLAGRIILNFMKMGFKPDYLIFERALLCEDDEILESMLQYFPLSSNESEKMFNDFSEEINGARYSWGDEKVEHLLAYAMGWLK
jgi:hypothetical protein